ncbi:MAG: hypothetical protein WBB45_12405 [Cyclobacteriaceae bacterium]
MKRKKITIESLQVSSFITNTQSIRGGAAALTDDDTNPETHDVSHAGNTVCGTEDIGCEYSVHNCSGGGGTQY